MSILKDGATYRFENRADGSRSLNVYGTSPVSLANVCLWGSSSDDICQQWVYEASANGNRGYLRCKDASGLYLDVYTGSGAANVVGYNAHVYAISNTAYLEIEEIAGGYIRIKSMYNGRYLTANQGSGGTSGGKDVNAPGNVYFYDGGLTDRSQDWLPVRMDADPTPDPKPEPGEYDKNYLIYPTTVMNLTQNYNDGNHYYCSHEAPADYPIDEASEGSGRSWFYCPCDKMKIMHITKTRTCTIWMESLTPVVTPSGTYDTITIMVMHPNRSEVIDLEGQTFYRGDKMFLEGTSGTNDPHFHMSVGTGHYQGNGILGWSGPKSDGVQWSMTPTGRTMKPEDMFFVDSSITQIKNTRGLNFIKIN